MTDTVCMQLLDEGTTCWRPVKAQALPTGAYRILGPVPEDEVWEFPPESIVYCEERFSDGVERWVVVSLAD
jgi:hypothetical protein